MELGDAFFATIELLPDPLLLVTVDGTILAVNAALLKQLDLPRQRLVDRSLNDLSCGPDADVSDYLTRCARSGQLLLGALTLRRHDGTQLKFRAGGSAFLNASKTGGKRAVILRLVPASEGGSAFVALNDKIQELNGEIARRRTIETALRKSEQSLHDVDRRKDEFLATLAHELRNPLAPIRNAMQLMARAPGDETKMAALRSMVERQLQHMVRLIDDLMDVSRITQGRLELRKERVDLDAVLQIAVETSLPLLQAKGHKLSVTSGGERIQLDADVTRLAQVFSNLLNNSAKYSPPGSEVSVTTRRHADQVSISFTDTGMGIPPSMLGRVFDIFFQLDRPGGREGLGIGLTLVKRIVELHGGTVDAVSGGEGQGTTFHVRLAAAQSATDTHPVDAVAVERTATVPTRILVADDNLDAAQTLALLLETEGHEVRTAHDGLEAIHVAEDFRPQIALLDIGMPRLDGYQTARRIRDQPWARAVTLVAVTGWGQEQDLRMAAAAGFDRHLVKPVDPQALTRMIGQMADAGSVVAPN